MREIVAARSTLRYHIAPYAASLLNHLGNGAYAVARGDPVLLAHRVLGATANAVFVALYLRHARGSAGSGAGVGSGAGAARNWLVAMCALGAFMAVEGFALRAAGRPDAAYAHLAIFAALTGVGLAASPLITLREVVALRDASSLPAALCFMVTVQCASWAVYGWVKRDWSTFANNVVGAALGAAQLALIAAFPRKRAAAGEAKRQGDRISVGSASAATVATGEASSAGALQPPLEP